MTDLAAVFLIGLLGVIHCVSMCGALMAACSMRLGGGTGFALTYNLGRVLTYSILGVLMGLMGKALMQAGMLSGFRSTLPVIAGVVMVLIGIDLLGLMPKAVKRFTGRLVPGRFFERFAKVGKKNKKTAAFMMGMVNGLIPCAMVYAVGAKAAATAEPVSGMLIMAALGAGTFLPLVFATSLAGSLRKFNSRTFTSVTALIIIALGVKTIYVTAFVTTIETGVHHMHMGM